MLGCTPHPPGLETLPHNLEEEGVSLQSWHHPLWPGMTPLSPTFFGLGLG